jgi:hypothetical protein
MMQSGKALSAEKEKASRISGWPFRAAFHRAYFFLAA